MYEQVVEGDWADKQAGLRAGQIDGGVLLGARNGP